MGDAPADLAAARSHLALAILLGFVAGCVDAISFDRVFQVFPANQSGNAALLGIDLGLFRAGQAWRPATSILGFGIGVAAAIVAGSRVRRRWRAELLIVAEVLLLVPLMLVVMRDSRPFEQLGSLDAACLLALTSCAMGLQTEVIGRVAGITVATTYQTGAITHIAESVAARISPAPRGRAVAGGLAVLLLVLTGYVGGAVLGAALRSWRFAVVVPIATLTVAAGALSVRSNRIR